MSLSPVLEGGISAIVVMSNAVDAKKAFKALAYSRFRTQPLYLEWAPGDVFGEEKKAEVSTEHISDNIVPPHRMYILTLEFKAPEHVESENNQEPETKAKKKKKTYEEKKAEKRKLKEGEVEDVNVEEVQSSSVDVKLEEEVSYPLFFVLYRSLIIVHFRKAINPNMWRMPTKMKC